MYATSNSKTKLYAFKGANPSWKTISIKRIRVTGGKVEIGFMAEGAGNSFCLVDDVEFVKVK
jgi:hypothetical protein